MILICALSGNPNLCVDIHDYFSFTVAVSILDVDLEYICSFVGKKFMLKLRIELKTSSLIP